MEVSLSLTFFSIGIAESASSLEGKPRVYFPDYGLKVMWTAENSDTQVGHDDFYFSITLHDETYET